MAKVDIFSGFLGAGKTTLIKKLIKEAYAGEQIVLIENEFGEIAVDGGFLADAGVKINEMSSGCICCSLVGDFKTALRQVVADYAPDRILIEPSGVGKLSDVIKAVIKAEDDALELDGFVAVVDANKAKVYMANFGEFFNDQIENAGTIILSRTGDISDKKLADAVEAIKAHNDKAVIITTPWDKLSGEQMKEAIERLDTLNAELEKLKAEHDEHGHHHHHHHHDDDECDDPECECHHHHHDDDDDDDEHEHHHHHHDGEECDDPECECHHHHHDDDDDDDEHEHHHHHHHHDGEECDDPECECHHHHDDDDDDECECGCGGHHHHHHHHHDADEIFTSWGVETTRKFTADGIQTILEELDDIKTYGIVLRAKGIVEGENGEWLHFDYVPDETNVRTGAAGITGRLCVIGSELKEDKIRELFGV